MRRRPRSLPTIDRGLYYLPEAAVMLRIPPATLRYWLYDAPQRPILTVRYKRQGHHWRRHRVLTDSDLTALSRAMLAATVPQRNTGNGGQPRARVK